MSGPRSNTCLVVLVALISNGAAWAAQFPSTPPEELVRAAVKNELHESDDLPKFMFVSRKETPKYSITRILLPTREAVVGRTIAYNDQPLTEEQRKNEDARLARYINDPSAMKEKQEQEKADKDRIQRIIKALPEAFLFEYDGWEPATATVGKKGEELLRLRLRANPDYDPPSRVEMILTGMDGTMLLDSKRQRIARLEGTLQKEVGFGWGILGHLDRGGHIVIEAADVGSSTWAITKIALSFTGKVLLFKKINVQSTETSRDFQRVVPMTFAEGVDLVKKREAALAPSASTNGHR